MGKIFFVVFVENKLAVSCGDICLVLWAKHLKLKILIGAQEN